MARFVSRVAASLLVLALMGCETAVSDDDSGDRLTQSDWVAQTIAGQPVINPGRVTLSFGGCPRTASLCSCPPSRSGC